MKFVAGTTQTSGVYGAWIGALIAGAWFYSAFRQGLQLQELTIMLVPMGMFVASVIGATCAILGTFAKRIHTAALAGATALAIPFVFLFLGSYFEFFPPTSTSRFLTLAGIIVLIGFLAGSVGGFVRRSENRKQRVLQ